MYIIIVYMYRLLCTYSWRMQRGKQSEFDHHTMAPTHTDISNDDAYRSTVTFLIVYIV